LEADCGQISDGAARMIERLLEPDSTAVPACKCGADMALSRMENRADDIQLKIFRCSSCSHELRLMVWSEETLNADRPGELARL
jgi:hypothetical protein